MVKQQLTTKEKKKIIKRVNVDGLKVADVAKLYGRTIKTIYNVLNGTTCVAKVQRRPAIDDDICEEIHVMIREDNEILSHQIRARLTRPVGISTINKIIREGPFYCKGRQFPTRRPIKTLCTK